MKKLIETVTGGYASSASVVDGTLILSLPDALAPVVWRMDLGHVKSSALEVRDQSDGTFMLTLKTPREDIHNIAPFATRAQAVRALMAVSRAMEQGHGQIKPAAALPANDDATGAVVAAASVRKKEHGKWATGAVALWPSMEMFSMGNLPCQMLAICFWFGSFCWPQM